MVVLVQLGDLGLAVPREDAHGDGVWLDEGRELVEFDWPTLLRSLARLVYTKYAQYS